jgi:hypothetical protein
MEAAQEGTQMDAERFDGLTKVFAGGVPRRRVLKALGGATAGALGLGTSAVEAAPPSGAGPCKSRKPNAGKAKLLSVPI